MNRRPVRRARAVAIEHLALTAVELLDDGGLRALTLRGVAQRMEVAPASLYSRVDSLDDLYDLALDAALMQDEELESALRGTDLHHLMLAYYRHLSTHLWACQVIPMRPPRGPGYLQLSERMCVLLADAGSADPLGDAYALSNFVIGSAATAPMAPGERDAPVDASRAPFYSSLHAAHAVEASTIVSAGLHALLNQRVVKTAVVDS